MKFRFIQRTVAILLWITLLLSGCVTTPTYSYTDTYLRISEPYGADFIFNGTVKEVTIGTHTYQFEASTSEEDRAAFITAQEALCDYLEKQGIQTTRFLCRILPEYENRAESDNKTAYFGCSTVKSWKQILTTLQCALGDYTNYGYLYALANHISEELKWERDLSEESTEILKKNPELLNLVYPCFHEEYTQSQKIASCKSLAKELLSAMEDPFVGEAKFIEKISRYAKDNDIDFSPTHLTFAYNGPGCPLKVRTKYLEVSRDGTYEGDKLYRDGFLETDYLATVETILETFEWLDEELGALRKKFGTQTEERVPVKLSNELPHMTNKYFENGGLCVYHETGIEIYATTLTCLAHEYIHYLYAITTQFQDKTYEPWHNEVLAYYYSLPSAFETRLIWAKNGGGLSLSDLEKIIGQKYDEPSDELLCLRFLIKQDKLPPAYYLKTTNDACSIFADYFIRQYGEEAFFQSMLTPSQTKVLTGVSMEQIVEDWSQDLKSAG